MALHYEMYDATGPGLEDCFFIGYRSATELEAEHRFRQSFVLHAGAGGATRLLWGPSSVHLGLSRSPQGTLFVADGETVRWARSTAGTPEVKWSSEALPYSVRGVFALDDGCAFAWGMKNAWDGKTLTKVFHASRFDGRVWQPLPAPPGEIWGLHALAPDFAYAVGPEALIARWDGSRWTRLPVLWDVNVLSGIHLVSRDEMYVCGQSALLEGTSHGWSVVARGASRLGAVVKHDGQVWAAGTTGGLLRLQRNALEVVNDQVKPGRVSLGSSGLLLSGDTRIAETADGKTLRAFNALAFANAVRHVPVPWDDDPADGDFAPPLAPAGAA